MKEDVPLFDVGDAVPEESGSSGDLRLTYKLFCTPSGKVEITFKAEDMGDWKSKARLLRMGTCEPDTWETAPRRLEWLLGIHRDLLPPF